MFDSAVPYAHSVDMTKSKHFGLRLDPEEHAELAAIAAEQERSISWLIRKIVTDWLKQQALAKVKRKAK